MRPVAMVSMLALVLGPLGVAGQDPQEAQAVELGGPRLGLTLVGGEIADKLREKYDAGAVLMQFGWQWEQAFLPFSGTGTTAVTEMVFLFGGAEQGLFLPSLTWLVGLRTEGGAEFGLGPNLSVTGSSLAFAGGVTYRAGDLNIPVNVAVVPSRSGPRVSVLTGFNVRLR